MRNATRSLEQPAAELTWSADAVVDEVLGEYEARQTIEDRIAASLSARELGDRRDEFLISVGRATGMLLDLLVRETGARSILELGTAFGYSTIWLARAARRTGGCITTVDIAADKQRHAQRSLERVGLLDHVRFRTCDVFDFLADTRETFDFVLLDVWKDAYVPCIDAVVERLSPNALIVADNMQQPSSVRFAAARYQQHVKQMSQLETIVLPVGSGVAVSRYCGP